MRSPFIVKALICIAILLQASPAYAYITPGDFIDQFNSDGGDGGIEDVPLPSLEDTSLDPNIPFPGLSSSSTSSSSSSSSTSSSSSSSTSSSSSSSSTSSSSSSRTSSSTASAPSTSRRGGGNAPQANLIDASHPQSSSSSSKAQSKTYVSPATHAAAPSVKTVLPKTGPSLAVCIFAASVAMLRRRRKGKDNEE